ncbi:hypothetical protein MMC14_006840 [Varicellaria rhodocarpa]|nr:hypothetical protein [Varicellaria rhodocarpa]
MASTDTSEAILATSEADWHTLKATPNSTVMDAEKYTVLWGANKVDISIADRAALQILKSRSDLSSLIQFITYVGFVHACFRSWIIAVYLNKHPDVREAKLTITDNYIRNVKKCDVEHRLEEWDSIFWAAEGDYRKNLWSSMNRGEYWKHDSEDKVRAELPEPIPLGTYQIYDSKGDSQGTLEECLASTTLTERGLDEQVWD